MRPTKQRQSLLQKGFTLVELLIVVIILAILAAIVVPQFASTTTDARDASLDTTLGNMRSAIDLYYQQHNSTFPGNSAASGATCPGGGTAGTGDTTTDLLRATAFISQMTMYTNALGQACSTTDAVFSFGPYLKKADLPDNPLGAGNALVVTSTGNLIMTGAAAPGAGWKYDAITGKFIADDTDELDR